MNFPFSNYRYFIYAIFFSLFIFLNPISALSRDEKIKYEISGKILDKQQMPIELACIVLNKTIFTLSNANGEFAINGIIPGEYEYVVSCLGYEELKGKLKITQNLNGLKFILEESALALQKVVVTAKSDEVGSKSSIGQNAIRHIQPKSVADMLQLLPGGVSSNPSLNHLAQAYIREIDGNANNALGTAVIVDGSPLCNDASLQSICSSKYGSLSSPFYDGMSEQTTAGKGVDLRTISADNIESLEVIRGIPSVEYGNLTSGVVIVKTKAGRTPLEVKIKADPFSKLIYAGKGFKLKKSGAINVGLDWSQSFPDVRRKYKGYDRITSSFAYSNIFHLGTQKTPLTFNAKASIFSTINNVKHDPILKIYQSTFKNKMTGGRVAINGNISPRKIITALNYSLSAQITKTEDRRNDLVVNPRGILTGSRENGLKKAYQNEKSYYANYFMKGLPFNFYAQLKANKYIQLRKNNYTDIKVGAEYRCDGNKGDGLVFDIKTPPKSLNSQSIRPRSYKDIPVSHNVSFFIENSSKFKIREQTIKTKVGVRASHLFLDKNKSGMKGITIFEPRINAIYTLIDKKDAWLNSPLKLSINAGYGISNKMPSMLYLYPDNAYYDNVSLNKIGNSPTSNLGLITTTIVENLYNPNLKPARSNKWEVGLNFKIGRIDGNITYFNEKFKHEFGFSPNLLFCRFKRFDVPPTADNLRFEKDNEESVYYTENGVEHKATFENKLEMNTYSSPDNNRQTLKHGVEYSINIGEFKSIRTSLNIDGAWFWIKRISTKNRPMIVHSGYDYVPIIPSGNGSIQSRINTNFRFITHIPVVKMIFTSTLQVIWYESGKFIYEDLQGNDRKHFSDNKNRYIVSPIGFYDGNEKYYSWKTEYENDPEYQLMNKYYMPYDFKTDKIKPWVLLNIRFTKEIGKIAEISFTANNLRNRMKWHINKHSQSSSQIFPVMYFGTELKFKF